MSIVAIWKNDNFALPLCSPIRFRPTSHQKGVVENPGCMCLVVKDTGLIEDDGFVCGCRCSGGFGNPFCDGNSINTEIMFEGVGGTILGSEYLHSTYRVIGLPDHTAFDQFWATTGAGPSGILPVFSHLPRPNSFCSGAISYIGGTSYEGTLSFPDETSASAFMEVSDNFDPFVSPKILGGLVGQSPTCGLRFRLIPTDETLTNPTIATFKGIIGPSPCIKGSDCRFCEDEIINCVPTILVLPPNSYNASFPGMLCPTPTTFPPTAFIDGGPLLCDPGTYTLPGSFDLTPYNPCQTQLGSFQGFTLTPHLYRKDNFDIVSCEGTIPLTMRSVYSWTGSSRLNIGGETTTFFGAVRFSVAYGRPGLGLPNSYVEECSVAYSTNTDQINPWGSFTLPFHSFTCWNRSSPIAGIARFLQCQNPGGSASISFNGY